MSLVPCLIAAVVAGAAAQPADAWLAGPGQAGQAPAPSQTDAAIARRLADAWTREGFTSLEPADVVPADLACGLAMFRQAAELRPDDPAMWRHLARAAQLAGPLVPEADSTARAATARLAKLEPQDQVIRLQRIVDAIEHRDTAEERISALRSFLAPEVVRSIGAPVAARLAFDLALLESRRGNMDAFAQDVAQALALCPAFPAAAQAAAGFFAERSEDPVGQAELLVTAVMADPGDERTLQRLGNLLLQYGAYGSAARVYRMAGDAAAASDRSQNTQDVIASDAALALWMSGRPADALELLRRRSQRRASAFVDSLLEMNPTMTRAEANAIMPRIPTIAASLEVALLRASGNAEGVAVSLQNLATGTTNAARTSPDQPQAMRTAAAETLLEGANALALLGGSAEQVRSMVAAAEQISPLTEQAKARFEAWILLNSGEPAKALELFAANASGDPVTAYGMAMAETAGGDRQKGMRALLDLARGARSMLPGALAAEEVRRVTGSPVPAEEVAARLDAVVAGIPPAVDRMLAGSDRALGLMLEPVSRSCRAFDPVLVDVRVQNRSSIPMAIDALGPIERAVAVTPRLSMTGESNMLRLNPVVVPIDRMLELGAGQAVTARIDLMWYAAGRSIVAAPLEGAQVGLRGSLNFLAGPGTVRHGSLGADATCDTIRVDGIFWTAAWLDESIAMVGGAMSDESVVRTALLLHLSQSKGATEEDRTRARDAALAAFPRWSAHARTWITLVAPRGEARVDQLAQLAWSDADPLVRAAAALAFAGDSRQAEVERALASEDAFERTVAAGVVSKFDRERSRIAERLRTGDRSQDPVSGTGAVAPAVPPGR